MKRWIALALLYAGFAALEWHQVPDWPYGYDEADYMFAASRGFGANYTDAPTMPIADFVRTGLSRGRAAGYRADLSTQIRNSNDIVFYRHWHGPLYFYWLAGMGRFAGDPRMMRGLQLMFPVLGAALIYWGCLRLRAGAQGWLAAILAAALYLWSEAVIRSPELAPHQLFALCTLGELFCLAAMMETGERRWWYGAVVMAALAACTLEVAFVGVIVALVCGHLRRGELWADGRSSDVGQPHRLRRPLWPPGRRDGEQSAARPERPPQPEGLPHGDLRFALKSVGLFVLTVLVVWPGAILKLSFVKAYAFMAWLALFRSHAWGTDMTAGQVWLERLEHAPVEWLIVLAGIVVFFRARSEERRVLLPFALFAGLMILVLLRVNGDAPRYTLPFMPALDVLAGTAIGWRLGTAPRRMAWAAMLAMCAGLFGARWYALEARPLGSGGYEKQVLEFVRDNGLANGRLLAPQGEVPMLHYYFPRASVTPYFDAQSFAAERERGSFAAVLGPGEPLRGEVTRR